MRRALFSSIAGPTFIVDSAPNSSSGTEPDRLIPYGSDNGAAKTHLDDHLPAFGPTTRAQSEVAHSNDPDGNKGTEREGGPLLAAPFSLERAGDVAGPITERGVSAWCICYV